RAGRPEWRRRHPPDTTVGIVIGSAWGLPTADLDDAVTRATDDLRRWKGARVLVTGGTGFLGRWLVSTLFQANRQLDLGLRLVLLTRHPAAIPLDDPSVELVGGDVRRPPPLGTVDAVVHGATASASTGPDGGGSIPPNPRTIAGTILDGTRAALEVAGASQARVLFLSSGAVYGRQEGSAVAEDDLGALDPLDAGSAYGEAKRMAENWCAATTAAGEVQAVVGRLFAFVGPGIPLRSNFAAGNFLADALSGGPVQVAGDGRAVRSYLYAGELSEWLLALLARGRPGAAYNVGSPEAVTIAELAGLVAALPDPSVPVQILGTPGPARPHRYVPDTGRAEAELGLRPRVGLPDALQRSFTWLAARAG